MKTHPTSTNGDNQNQEAHHVRQKSSHRQTPSFFSKQSLMKISPEPFFVSSSKLPLNSSVESEYENFAFETHRVIEENVSQKSQENLIGLFDNDERKTFEDGSLSKLKFQRFQIMDMSTGIIAMIGTCLTIMAVYYYEI